MKYSHRKQRISEHGNGQERYNSVWYRIAQAHSDHSLISVALSDLAIFQDTILSPTITDAMVTRE